VLGGVLFAFVEFKIIIAIIVVIFIFAVIIECLLKFDSKGNGDIDNNLKTY